MRHRGVVAAALVMVSRGAAGQTRAAAEPEGEATVRAVSAAERARQGAAPVTVIALDDARRESADLGEVLARTEGLSVRRAGGLGSAARLSLNGLQEDQVRVFFDGIPLELTGFGGAFGGGLASVPVNLVERVEVYRGLVPTRFGADALGGAIALVSDGERDRARSAFALEHGSFGTWRASASARRRLPRSGVVLGAWAFADRADNNYEVDVEIADTSGRLAPQRVPRFHDGFRAYGGGVEVSLRDLPWARRATARAFFTRVDRELQHNAVMTVPYGEVTYGATSVGANARVERPAGPRGRLGYDLAAGWARRAVDLRDVSRAIYDWFGSVIGTRMVPGERGTEPADQTLTDDIPFARLTLAWAPSPATTLRLSAAPTLTLRDGVQRFPRRDPGRDTAEGARLHAQAVVGVDWEQRALGGRFENVAMVKGYGYYASAEEFLPAGAVQMQTRHDFAFGVGDAARLRIGASTLRASYEYAVRLPRVDEIFGNGVLVLPNLDLEPERSHNLNLGWSHELTTRRRGGLRVGVDLFARFTDRQVVLIGTDRSFSHQNVYAARTLGVEAAMSWTVPGEWLSLDANATWQDARNDSAQGTFGDFDGDRIPNRPWLFANATLRLRAIDVPRAPHQLQLVLHARYVHAFFRSWESSGLREFKQEIPAQFGLNLAATWSLRAQPSLAVTGEVQNLTDAPLYDFYGVQRPGRSLFVKFSSEF